MIKNDIPTLTDVELKDLTCKPEEIRAYAQNIDGAWIACAFVDRGKTRIVLAIHQGKSRDKVLREVVDLAIERTAPTTLH